MQGLQHELHGAQLPPPAPHDKRHPLQLRSWVGLSGRRASASPHPQQAVRRGGPLCPLDQAQSMTQPAPETHLLYSVSSKHSTHGYTCVRLHGLRLLPGTNSSSSKATVQTMSLPGILPSPPSPPCPSGLLLPHLGAPTPTHFLLPDVAQSLTLLPLRTHSGVLVVPPTTHL